MTDAAAPIEDLAVVDSADRDESIGGIVLARAGLGREVRELSTVSDLRGAWAIARQWLVIAVAAGLAVWSGHWAVYLAAMVVIATRQHALGIIMHDATHYRIFTNRTVNDVVCDIFCSFPVGMTTSRYRYEHMLHHRYLNTDGDPYWVYFEEHSSWHWPKRPLEASWVFLRDLLGLNTLRNMQILWRWTPWCNHFSRRDVPPPLTLGERLRLYLFFAGVIAVLAATNGWLTFFILWMVPLPTLTMAMVRFRTIAEHLAIPNEHELNATRHVDGTLLERLSISPLNINYHIAHHLFPSVPYYNLPKLHDILMRNEHFRRRARICKDYLSLEHGVLGEMLAKPDEATERVAA